MKQFDIYDTVNTEFDVSEADWVRVTVSIDREALQRYMLRAASVGISRSRFLGLHLMLTESVSERALLVNAGGLQ